MRRSRLLIGMTVMAGSIVWGSVSTLQALPPGAAPTPGMTLSPTSGDSSTEMTLRLAAPDNACPGDTVTGNYRWNTFMVPASVDVGTLTYNSQGPMPSQFDFPVTPLFTAIGGSAIINKATAVQTGQIVGTSTISFAAWQPGFLPPGQYKIGYACTKVQALGQPAETQRFWEVPITVTQSDTGGPAQIAWTAGTPTTTTTPATTTTTTVLDTSTTTTVPRFPPPTPERGIGNSINVRRGTSTTPFTLTLAPSSNACQGDTTTGGYRFHQFITTADPATLRNATGAFLAPFGAFVQPLYSTTGVSQVNKPTAPGTGELIDLATLDFSRNTLPGNGVYNIGFLCTVNGVTTRYWSTQITVGALVAPSTFDWAILSPLTQTVSATKVGAGGLTIRQRCGAFGATVSIDDPDLGFLPVLPPSLGTATESTQCGVDMGASRLLDVGPRQGQFYGATGRINQIEVVDTRPGNLPWTVSATFTPFSNGGIGLNDSFSSNLLGWRPQVSTAIDAIGNPDFRVVAGDAVEPSTGSSVGRTLTLATALPGKTATFVQLDARLKLFIPVAASNGRYQTTITFTVI